MIEPRSEIAAGQAVAPEDQARAGFYALLSRLYAAAPEAALLRAVGKPDALKDAAAGGGPATLAARWQALGLASEAVDASAVADEYQTLFIGVGKSEVSLHASAYLPSRGRSPLAEIRANLVRLGLARKSGVSIYEDHLAALCETMWALIAGTDAQPAAAPRALEEQRAFFERHIAPWVFDCCSAIQASPLANYYRRVAEFTQSFMAIERDSFAIE